MFLPVFGHVLAVLPSLSGPDGALLPPAILASLAVGFLGARIRGRRPEAQEIPDPHALRITIAEDGRVVSCRGGYLLERGRKPPEDADAIVRLLGEGGRALEGRLAALTGSGLPFETDVWFGDGQLCHASGRIEGFFLRVDLLRASEGERRLRRELDASAEIAEDRDRFRQRAELAVVPIYETDAAGALTWSNPACDRLFRTGEGPAGTRADLPPPGGGLLKIRNPDGAELGWVRLTTSDLPDGRRLTSVEDLDAQVRAEESLQSFVATMTDTFAGLDVALAIFDRDRRLNLFNPALADLFGIDPAALAARPSLRTFLEMLRERRMTPEQKNFAVWRRDLMERGGGDGARGFSEDWTLPSGSILRVTGRPHPKGALAYVFQDISGLVMMESRYLGEIARAQAIFDHLTDGMAVFGTSGEMLLANTAFEAQWNMPVMTDADGATVDRVLAALSEQCQQSAVWPRIKAFVLGTGRDDGLAAQVVTRAGNARSLSLHPLPDGSTLIRVTGAEARAMRTATVA